MITGMLDGVLLWGRGKGDVFVFVRGGWLSGVLWVMCVVVESVVCLVSGGEACLVGGVLIGCV